MTALTCLAQQLPQSRHNIRPGKPGLGRAATRDVGWYRRGLAGLLTGLALLAGALAGCSAVGSRGALRPRADDGELGGRACGRGRSRQSCRRA
jgi:hypothetical protein